MLSWRNLVAKGTKVFKFHKCYLDKRFKNKPVWMLELSKDNLKAIIDFNTGFMNQRFIKSGIDPHTWVEGTSNCETKLLLMLRHPLILAGNQLVVFLNKVNTGRTLLVQNTGSFVVKDDSVEIIETVERPDFNQWPEIDDKKEIIYISKWPDGTHYYLRGKTSNNRVFNGKYNSFDEAYAAAKEITDESCIVASDIKNDSDISKLFRKMQRQTGD